MERRLAFAARRRFSPPLFHRPRGVRSCGVGSAPSLRMRPRTCVVEGLAFTRTFSIRQFRPLSWDGPAGVSLIRTVTGLSSESEAAPFGSAEAVFSKRPPAAFAPAAVSATNTIIKNSFFIVDGRRRKCGLERFAGAYRFSEPTGLRCKFLQRPSLGLQ